MKGMDKRAGFHSSAQGHLRRCVVAGLLLWGLCSGALAQPAAAPRALPGTAWKIDFGKGVTGTLFMFCRSGTWEIVPARRGSIGAVGKSFRVSGSKLTTVNRDDGMVQSWDMQWVGDVLVINDGAQALRLHHAGETKC